MPDAFWLDFERSNYEISIMAQRLNLAWCAFGVPADPSSKCQMIAILGPSRPAPGIDYS